MTLVQGRRKHRELRKRLALRSLRTMQNCPLNRPPRRDSSRGQKAKMLILPTASQKTRMVNPNQQRPLQRLKLKSKLRMERKPSGLRLCCFGKDLPKRTWALKRGGLPGGSRKFSSEHLAPQRDLEIATGSRQAAGSFDPWCRFVIFWSWLKNTMETKWLLGTIGIPRGVLLPKRGSVLSLLHPRQKESRQQHLRPRNRKLKDAKGRTPLLSFLLFQILRMLFAKPILNYRSWKWKMMR
mmetsp:Transcript_19366/g.41717  ORF Transcript_19366/g.41717 Transcript_19366/m.41717 type:complete len:239 (-) Transcript_19366:982-1698(-)